jgi:hypothetical protein
VDPAGAPLLADLRKAEVVEIVRKRVLRGLLHQLETDGVDALLLKGSGLAYTLYASPHLRRSWPRGHRCGRSAHEGSSSRPYGSAQRARQI